MRSSKIALAAALVSLASSPAKATTAGPAPPPFPYKPQFHTLLTSLGCAFATELSICTQADGTWYSDAKVLSLKNQFNRNATKYVSLDIAYNASYDWTPLIPPLLDAGLYGDPPTPFLVTLTGDFYYMKNDLQHVRYDWTITPQPKSEVVDISTLLGDGDLSHPKFDVSEMVSISLQSACTPEPETWALMIIGFGVIGSAARVRRRRSDVRRALR